MTLETRFVSLLECLVFSIMICFLHVIVCVVHPVLDSRSEISEIGLALSPRITNVKLQRADDQWTPNHAFYSIYSRLAHL